LAKQHEMKNLENIIDFLQVYFKVMRKDVIFVNNGIDFEVKNIRIKNEKENLKIEVKNANLLQSRGGKSRIGHFIFTQKDVINEMDYFLLVINCFPYENITGLINENRLKSNLLFLLRKPNKIKEKISIIKGKRKKLSVLQIINMHYSWGHI